MNSMQKKGTRTISIMETCASPSQHSSYDASLYARRTIPTNERKRKVIHAHSSDGGDLAVTVSKMGSKILLQFDYDESQTDGLRYWVTTRPVLFGAFVHEGAPDFDEDFWLHLIHEVIK